VSEKSQLLPPEDLRRIAGAELRRHGLRGVLADEACAEFIAGAWEAGQAANPEGNPRGYQLKTGRGRMLTFLRSRRREEQRAPLRLDYAAGETDLHDALADETVPCPYAHAADDEMQKRIRTAFEALPHSQRHILQLAVIENKGPLEIGRMLGVSKNTAAKRRDKALAALRKRLGIDDEGAG